MCFLKDLNTIKVRGVQTKAESISGVSFRDPNMSNISDLYKSMHSTRTSRPCPDIYLSAVSRQEAYEGEADAILGSRLIYRISGVH